jgi:hypothetical protein
MMDRNTRILANRAELLLQRIDAVERDLPSARRRVAELSAAYDRVLAARELASLSPVKPRLSASLIDKRRRLNGEVFRQAFALGLVGSLLLGLLVIFGS